MASNSPGNRKTPFGAYFFKVDLEGIQDALGFGRTQNGARVLHRHLHTVRFARLRSNDQLPRRPARLVTRPIAVQDQTENCLLQLNSVAHHEWDFRLKLDLKDDLPLFQLTCRKRDCVFDHIVNL